MIIWRKFTLYTCVCGKQFWKIRELTMHNKNWFLNGCNNGVTEVLREAYVTANPIFPLKYLTCILCHLEVNNDSALTDHMKEIHRNCVCGKRFFTIKELVKTFHKYQL